MVLLKLASLTTAVLRLCYYTFYLLCFVAICFTRLQNITDRDIMCISGENHFTILLVGKTGSGKSATANSLLGQNLFKESDMSVSETTQIQVQSATLDGCTLTVVDTPGVMHTGLDLEAIKLKACNDMKEAVSKCPDYGKMAVVIVMKYGDRFTEENETTVDILKQMFGEENLCKSCIIVMTHGDMFALNYQQEKQFKDWMADQKEELGQLFSLVQYRCLLFNNRSRKIQEKNEQIQKIRDLILNLDHTYTKMQFFLLKKQHRRLELQIKFPHLQQFYQQKTQNLIDSFHLISMSSKSFNSFEDLGKMVTQCLEELNQEDDPFFYVLREELWKLKLNIIKETIIREQETKIDRLSEDLDHIIKEKEFERIYFLEARYKTLLDITISAPVFYSLKSKLDIVHKKILKANRKMIKILFKCQINSFENDIKKIEVPTFVHTFSHLFNRLNEIKNSIHEENLRFGGLDNLLEDVDNLKIDIQYLKEDNDIWIGWKTTSAIVYLIGTFIGITIPIFGVLISMALNIIVKIGRFIHTTVVRRRRSKVWDRK